jgi:hypothetical protein
MDFADFCEQFVGRNGGDAGEANQTPARSLSDFPDVMCYTRATLMQWFKGVARDGSQVC